ncbi:MAG: DUF1887 family protein [Clostridia bacterium]|nr:DUF1887 family protein [Clostridia bacterium]
METLIELYDERPLENVLSPQVFMPKRVVYICPKEIHKNERAKKVIRSYLKGKGFAGETDFVCADMFSAKDVHRALVEICVRYSGPVVDITGGTDQALFAAGVLSAENATPAFTYSRRANKFFSIHDAPFGEEMACDVKLSVEDCFAMAGGAVKRGRVDNGILSGYMDSFEPFFEVFLRFKREWTSLVNWMQRASAPVGGEISLDVDVPCRLRGERGMIKVNEDALRQLEAMGFLKKLHFYGEDRVRFAFSDGQVRYWLRDVGSVLETYVYKACINTGLFDDVCTSVVVDWEGDLRQGNVTNELDVMATRGIMPVFISCKTGEIRTEALNELSVLRDRFGGKIARAAIVSATKCQLITRHRANELGIEVIDYEDLKRGRIGARLKTLAKPL